MSGLFSSPGKANQPIVYSSLQVSTSQLDLPVPIGWGQYRAGTNATWFNNFQKHAQSPKGKGGGGKGGQQYDYTAALILALCEGPIDSIANVWPNGSTTTVTTLSDLDMSLFTGTAAQAPWSYVTTNYPAEARSYAYTAYLVCSNLDLGSSATVPDNAFEVVRSAGFAYTHSTDGWKNPTTGTVTPAIDCLLSDIIPDFLTNPQYGGYMASGDLGSISQFAAYQRAQGLFFSPLLSSQSKVTEILDRWAQLGNSWIFWSGTQLEFVPLGDAAITGNGVTYTPQLDVAYDLGPNDFIVDSASTPPVKTNIKDPADCYNRTTLSFTDRTKGYVSNPAEYKDQTLIDTPGIGQRDSNSVQADDIKDPAVAAIAVQLIGKRAAYIRRTYSFTTSYRFVRVLPGTILTLTEPNAGLDHVRVRVTGVKRDDRRRLQFDAEEFPGTVGVYVPPLAVVAPATPTFPNWLAAPGNVNTPAVVEPSSAFTGGQGKLIIAASGGASWGGCEVMLSFDGASYVNLGAITSKAPQGTLTASLAAGAGNPDTTHTLSVDLTESLTAVPTLTHADADARRSLALVAAQPTTSGSAKVIPSNGELLAIGANAVTGTWSSDLTYLQRGLYGTANASHSSGDQFTMIDALGNTGTSLVYDLPEQYIGQTLYLKFLSYNLFERMVQDPSVVVEYHYTPTGAGYGTGSGGVPATPTSLTGSDTGSDFALGWAANTATDNVVAYSVYRASGAGASFGSATKVWSGNTLAFTDPGVPDGTSYTYFLTATNAVGESGHTAGVSVTAAGPAAPSIVVLAIVWSQNVASETAGARVKATVSGASGTDPDWWVRWKASSDTTWNEQRFTGFGTGPVDLLTGFVSTNDSIDVEAAYQPSGRRQSAWSSTGTVSTHPTADNDTVTADTTTLRASAE